MCGPTAAQSQLQTSQAAFYQQLQNNDETEFGEDQGILKQMQSVYAPILAKGPNQDGFSTAEETNLNTQATEGVGQNFANASKALKENQAASGGDTFLPSGVNAQQQGALDMNAASEQSQEQQQIKQAGYTQGYSEFTQATSALENTAGQLNPNAGAEVANSAGTAEGTTANQIAQENESWMAPLTGAIGAVGGAATGGYLSNR